MDVVAAVVETHGRAETETLLQGLDLLPKRAQFTATASCTRWTSMRCWSGARRWR